MKISRLVGLLLALLLAVSPVWALDGMVGLGVGMAPDYEGSEDSTGVPLFLFQHNYDSGRFFKLNGPNLKVNLLADNQFSLAPVLNYRFERDDVDLADPVVHHISVEYLVTFVDEVFGDEIFGCLT